MAARVNTVAPSAAGLIGQRVRKHDGDQFLRGAARYTGDLTLPGMLHATLVRSPHAHARIVSVDATQALARPGVHLVLDGERALDVVDEVPHSMDPAAVGGNHGAIRVLAAGKTIFAGEPVVAVVADTEGDAAAAAAAVEVIYEPLEPVLGAEAALLPGSPLVYEEWGMNLIVGGELGTDDFEEVAAGCAHVIEGEVHGHRGNAAPMEPRVYLADWDVDRERLTMYASTQNPHPLRATLAQALRMREDDIQVIAPRVGGSFGLKMYGSREEVLIAALARLVGRPVRWFEDRASALLPGAREQVLRYRVACDGDGRVEAIDVDMLNDHGAVGNGHGWGMAFVSALCVGAGYAVKHCHVTYRIVATNKAPWGGTKPFGKDGATLVIEHALDRVAAATGVDPAEVRRRNFLAPDAFPHVHTSGLELDSGDYEGTLDLALRRLDYARARAEQVRALDEGRRLGIGIGFELMPENADVPGAMVAAFDTTTVRMNSAGQVTVLTGVTSPGSGSDTGIAQIVAHELGLGIEDVRLVQGDTDRTPFGYGNLSSRSIVTGGSSAALAARDVAAKLRLVAATMLDAEPTQIELIAGHATVAGEPDRAVPLAAVAAAVYSLAYVLALGIEPNLESTRTHRPSNIRHHPDALGRLNTYSTYPFAVHVSMIELDAETGVLTVLRHVVAHDCGTVINPMLVDGQLVGGTVMGLGTARGEEFLYDDEGRPVSVGFKTYLLARAEDLPAIELEHQCTPTPVTPLGAKGVGEAGFSGAQAALLGAVNDALGPLGARIDRMPASPPNVLRAIGEAAA